MNTLKTLVVSVALCLPLVAAHADEMKAHGTLKGHSNLVGAEGKLHSAAKSITKSQEANECVFGMEGGHGQKAKEAIEAAEKQTWEAAEWINTHANDCADWEKAGKKGGEKPTKPELKGHPNLKGHGNMVAAEKDLIAAYQAITKSQEANECVFGIEGGHGQKAKEAIDAAFKQVTEAAEWVNTHDKDCAEWGKKNKK